MEKRQKRQAHSTSFASSDAELPFVSERTIIFHVCNHNDPNSVTAVTRRGTVMRCGREVLMYYSAVFGKERNGAKSGSTNSRFACQVVRR